MPKKFIACTRKLLKKGYGKSAYPICRVSTGYHGSSHNIGLLKPIIKKKDLIHEHKRLIRVLESGSKKVRLKEAKLQRRELKSYLKRK